MYSFATVPLFYQVPKASGSGGGGGGVHTRQARARSKDTLTPPGSPTMSPASPSSTSPRGRRRSLTRSISGKLNLEVQASDADGTVTIGDSLQALCARLQVQRIGAKGTCLVNRFVVVLSGVLCEDAPAEGGQEPATRYYCAGDAFEPRGGRERSVRAAVSSDGSVPTNGAAPTALPRRGPGGAGRGKLAGGRSSPNVSVDVGVQGAVASGKASITTSTPQGGAADGKQFAWAMTVHAAAMALYRKELRAACHAEATRKAGLDMEDQSVKRESFTEAAHAMQVVAEFHHAQTGPWRAVPTSAADPAPAGIPALESALVRSFLRSSQNFVVTDPRAPDNPIIFASEQFYALTGYVPAEVIGRNCRFLQGPKTDARTVQLIRDTLRRGDDEATVCLLNYRKDGTTFYNQLLLAPLRGPGGEVENYVGVQEPVSEEHFNQACEKQSGPSPEQGPSTLAGRLRQSLADGEPLAPPRIPALKLGELEGALAQASTWGGGGGREFAAQEQTRT